ncbi:MAG: hypothetical protein E6G32_04635 [Actinobacteria bacterium]|nr:MAG: hypothetical protein E6G32_04635 [Actinomycetota bacterium]
MRSRSLLVLALTATVGLVLAAAAAAKGPSEAKITGPGLSSPLVLKGNGEGPGSPLGDFTQQAGFFPAMFGQSPDPMLQLRPAASLGPRYTVTYTVPGPDNVSDAIRQDLYPYAQGSPVTYMKPGQLFFGRERTHGGWYRGSSTLRTLLVKEGLPAQAPAVMPRASRARFPSRAVAIGGALAVVLGVIGASSIARWRPNRSTSDTKEPPG